MLFSDDRFTYPLHVRQAMADQNSAPQRDNGTLNAALAKEDDGSMPGPAYVNADL